jgi:hypothetical protein
VRLCGMRGCARACDASTDRSLGGVPRACASASAQIVGALSDPTTDLGIHGLDKNQFHATLSYVQRVMLAVQTRALPELAIAEGDFQRLPHEMQYELSGAYASSYLAHTLIRTRGNDQAQGATEPRAAAEAEEVLYQARARKILCSPTTLLGQKMQFDVYPDQSIHDSTRIATEAASEVHAAELAAEAAATLAAATVRATVRRPRRAAAAAK